MDFSIYLYQRILMNYNHINRNSLISCIYSDRPTTNYAPPSEAWRAPEQHLNPSKSKVNVRQSLNKTVEGPSTTNSTITSIRNSCLLTTAASAHPMRQDAFLEDKFFKASKENQEPVSNAREHFSRYSQVMPPKEERRKSDSAHFRAASSNDFLFKLEEFRHFDLDIPKPEKPERTDRPDRPEKTQPQTPQHPQGTEQLREMIVALSKRVTSSEQQISRLKEREKRVLALQGEVADHKGKMFELAKFNSKNFVEMEAKLQHHQQAIAELREKVTTGHQEDWSHRTAFLEHRVGELDDGLRIREESEKQLNGQLLGLENALRKLINEEVSLLRSTLDLSRKDNTDILSRLKRLQADSAEKGSTLIEDHRKSSRKSSTSLMVENKETLLVRDGELIRDRTRQLLNLPHSSKRDFHEDYMDTPRREAEGRRELIIRQKVYFIDTSGYLLDENKYYLLNGRNQQIMLPEHLIALLRDNQMLGSTLGTPRR